MGITMTDPMSDLLAGRSRNVLPCGQIVLPDNLGLDPEKSYEYYRGITETPLVLDLHPMHGGEGKDNKIAIPRGCQIHIMFSDEEYKEGTPRDDMECIQLLTEMGCAIEGNDSILDEDDDDEEGWDWDD
jgi:hypothetical protein